MRKSWNFFHRSVGRSLFLFVWKMKKFRRRISMKIDLRYLLYRTIYTNDLTTPQPYLSNIVCCCEFSCVLNFNKSIVNIFGFSHVFLEINDEESAFIFNRWNGHNVECEDGEILLSSSTSYCRLRVQFFFYISRKKTKAVKWELAEFIN